ncbi:MAG: tetratricopeptide repeat protein [Betaproteobacteria bacterium]|jgi:tetratricopeptide (TPR) repeat protein|nr:tetratricopeptide repeat protein [Rubrivivax sp.]
MTTPRSRATLGVLASLALLGPAAQGADTTPEPPPPPRYSAPAPAPLATAQGHIQAARWPEALAELRRLNLERNADWNNLMGYVLRKQAAPDLDGAQRFYDAALRIDPNHLGALEYVGELALTRKDLPAAEAYLARLQRACGIANPCAPLDALKKAVAAYKAGGK